MCDYLTQIHEACDEFTEKGVAFDILQIRNRVRELAHLGADVRFREVKYEVLARFESGLMPGFVLTTKKIVTPSLSVWDGRDDAGVVRNVFNLVPYTDIINGISPTAEQATLSHEHYVDEGAIIDGPGVPEEPEFPADALGPMPW